MLMQPLYIVVVTRLLTPNLQVPTAGCSTASGFMPSLHAIRLHTPHAQQAATRENCWTRSCYSVGAAAVDMHKTQHMQ